MEQQMFLLKNTIVVYKLLDNKYKLTTILDLLIINLFV